MRTHPLAYREDVPTASPLPVDSAHQAWLDRVALAELAVPIIGRLYRERDVVTHVHGKKLVNQSPIDIMKAHKWARRVGEHVLSIEQSMAVLRIADDLGYAYSAGEQALATGARRHLVREHGMDKRRITFTGYWKLGKAYVS